MSLFKNISNLESYLRNVGCCRVGRKHRWSQ